MNNSAYRGPFILLLWSLGESPLLKPQAQGQQYGQRYPVPFRKEIFNTTRQRYSIDHSTGTQ